MRNSFYIYLSACIGLTIHAQDNTTVSEPAAKERMLIGCNLGVSLSYSDRAFLHSVPVSASIDYQIWKGLYVQAAPKYSWVYKWNEHYLTLAVHARMKLNNRISLYAGPCITWDIGYFRDLGISAGIYFHLTKNASLQLSLFTFTLYDYYIDYRYLPVGISYNHILYAK